jgi:hypothetical protein
MHPSEIGFFKKKKKKKGGGGVAPAPAPLTLSPASPLGPLGNKVGGVPVWAVLLAGGGVLAFFMWTLMKGRKGRRR